MVDKILGWLRIVGSFSIYMLKQVGTLESALKEQLVSAETVLQPAEMSEDMSEKESDEGRADRTGEAREDGDKE